MLSPCHAAEIRFRYCDALCRREITLQLLFSLMLRHYATLMLLSIRRRYADAHTPRYAMMLNDEMPLMLSLFADADADYYAADTPLMRH